jgi:acyl-[acyl-carrier-protein] desaturase
MPPWTQIELLTELEPVVGRELDRHLRSAREWFPHEYVPWSDGRNFDGCWTAMRGIHRNLE